MYKGILDIIMQHGYSHIPLNVSNLYVHLQVEHDEGFVVVTVDETSGIRYNHEQFQHISGQIRDYLSGRNCYTYHFLYLIISNDTDAGKRLLDHFECYWRIEPGTGRLMVYEMSNDNFLTLRKPIEDYLYRISSAADTMTTADSETIGGIFDQEINPLFAPVNLILIILNVVIFLLNDVITIKGNTSLIDSGALSWDMFFNYHEYYRIITCMFLHSGIDHIFNNMLVLLFIGSYLEQAVGKGRYLIIYLGSGILAGYTSMVYNMMQDYYTQSVGASGAIFGVMGAMLCIILIKHHQSDNIDLRKITFMVFLSLYGGFTSQGVDNAAHVGGFIGGFIISLLISMIRSKRKAGINS